MIAVSLNVGGGVRLIKPTKLYICTQKHYKHSEDGRTAPGVCGNGSVPLSHSENVVKRIGIHTHSHADVLFMMSHQLRLGRCQQRSECKTLDLKATLNYRSQGHNNLMRSQCANCLNVLLC